MIDVPAQTGGEWTVNPYDPSEVREGGRCAACVIRDQRLEWEVGRLEVARRSELICRAVNAHEALAAACEAALEDAAAGPLRQDTLLDLQAAVAAARRKVTV